jgi:hypothetical protein
MHVITGHQTVYKKIIRISVKNAHDVKKIIRYNKLNK